jgi:hypothetical protein
MKKILSIALIGLIAAGVLSVGAILLAQERGIAGAQSGPLVVLGGLKLKEGADAEGAEKLLKEQLIPAMTGVEGLKMRILKKMEMQQGGQTADTGVYDYIMMAEVEKPQVLMQLMQKGYQGKTGLSKFGDMMKEYAGSPYINVYTIIARTKEAE